MEIIPSYSLLEHNTFRVEAKAQWWIAYRDIEDLKKLAKDEYFETLSFINLGLGANTLFLGDYKGAVLHSQITSIEEVGVIDSSMSSDSTSSPLIRVGSGVVWDEFVAETIARGFYGLENLSGIPASVGAAIVQNIGAYGSEVGHYVEEIEAFDLGTGKVLRLCAEEAQFGYRSSLFKTPQYDKVVITHVTFRLSTKPQPNLTYRALAEAFEGVVAPTPLEVRHKVLAIRGSKLPKVEEYPNAGSFFKNPLVSQEKFESIQKEYSSVPHWLSPNGDPKVKLSAAWLIDQAGYKGKRIGSVGCYPLQPLVIVNYGTPLGKEILLFSEKVKHAVRERFGIELEPEVRMVGTLHDKGEK